MKGRLTSVGAVALLSASAGCWTSGTRREAPSGRASVDASRPVTVMGEVRRPGRYRAVPDAGFIEFMLSAQGLTETADFESIELLRPGPEGWRVHRLAWAELASAPVPRGGDVIIVHSISMDKTERALRAALAATAILNSVNAAGSAFSGGVPAGALGPGGGSAEPGLPTGGGDPTGGGSSPSPILPPLF